MSLRPKEADCGGSLRKNKKHFWKYKMVHWMHANTRFRNGYLSATESCETTQNISLRPREVDWACSLRKNKKCFQKHKVVHCMHPNTHFCNGYLSTMILRETSQNTSLRHKQVDCACSLRKDKKLVWKHKVVRCMHPNTLFGAGTFRQRNRAKPPRT